jgi:hypothetical protein
MAPPPVVTANLSKRNARTSGALKSHQGISLFVFFWYLSYWGTIEAISREGASRIPRQQVPAPIAQAEYSVGLQIALV